MPMYPEQPDASAYGGVDVVSTLFWVMQRYEKRIIKNKKDI